MKRKLGVGAFYAISKVVFGGGRIPCPQWQNGSKFLSDCYSTLVIYNLYCPTSSYILMSNE